MAGFLRTRLGQVSLHFLPLPRLPEGRRAGPPGARAQGARGDGILASCPWRRSADNCGVEECTHELLSKVARFSVFFLCSRKCSSMGKRSSR